MGQVNVSINNLIPLNYRGRNQRHKRLFPAVCCLRIVGFPVSSSGTPLPERDEQSKREREREQWIVELREENARVWERGWNELAKAERFLRNFGIYSWKKRSAPAENLAGICLRDFEIIVPQ